MKTTKEKVGFIYHIPEDSSDEMKSRMGTLNRNQLEMLIFILIQEILRLKHQLESHSSFNSDPDLTIINGGCQNEDTKSTQSKTNCSACQRNLRSISNLSQFQTLGFGDAKEFQTLGLGEAKEFQTLELGEAKEFQTLELGEAKQFQTLELGEAKEFQTLGEAKEFQTLELGEAKELGKNAHYLINGVCDKAMNSNSKIGNEVICRNSIRSNIDAQLACPQPGQMSLKMDNLTSVGASGRTDNHVKEFEGLESHEDLFSSTEKSIMSIAEAVTGKRSSCEKPLQLDANCNGYRKCLRSQMREVKTEHNRSVTNVDNSSSNESLQSNACKRPYQQNESLKANADVILPRSRSKYSKSGRVQHSYNSKPCQVSKQSSVISTAQVHVDTAEGKRETFSCCACKDEFQSKLMLTLHMTMEHKAGQHSCMICGKSFRYKHNLKIHQKHRHNRTTVLCSYCGKLVLQTRLETHMEKVHEKPMFTCHICQKGFLKRECLEGHINKHSNTKPYICECCGRKYAYSTSLSSHKKLCSRAFMPSHLLHPRSLDNKNPSFICEMCGVKFEGVSGLKDHTSAKHSNKTQSCSFCGKGFQWRPSYNRHIKKCKDRTELERDRCKQLLCQKSVGKQFNCVCGKQYLYRQSYRRHEKVCKQKQEIESYMTGSAV